MNLAKNEDVIFNKDGKYGVKRVFKEINGSACIVLFYTQDYGKTWHKASMKELPVIWGKRKGKKKERIEV